MLYLDWISELTTPPSPAQTQEVQAAVANGEDAFAALARLGIAEAEAAVQTFSRHLRVPRVALATYEPAAEALTLLSEEQTRKLGILPLFVVDAQLYAAIDDPVDLRRLDQARHLVQMRIEPVLARRHEIDAAITRHYLTRDRISETLDALVAATPTAALTAKPVSSVEEDRESPTVQMITRVIERGIRLGASDIHLERNPEGPRLRYRIDGILHEFPGLTDALYEGGVSRIKIISRLNIAETRAPQDGRASVTVDGSVHDLRVSTLPQIHGEGVVLRVLNTGWEARLDRLGMPDLVLERFRQEIHRPEGLVLVTGPTGSGKTTTLYAALRELVHPSRKFLSVEDPVENVISGVNQVQVEEDAGRGFAASLRAFLRHDPDVAMLGEIRDLESAEIAVRAAQTGHLILSTLHTNSALLTMTRLVDIGIPAYVVLSSLNIVLSQRLVRRLCVACKRPASQIPALPFTLAPSATVFEAVGCEQCNHFGYRGRVGIYEMLAVTPAMRELGSQRVEPRHLRETCGPNDYLSLADAAKLRLEHGETSISEILMLLTGRGA